MAVFWFGWAKKIKNVFTKKEADQYYLQKNSNQLQQVSGFVDFTSNVVCKRNGYVDNVDTNAPTSMINKQYLEQQLTTTKNQIRSENNTFTGTNTFNNGFTVPNSAEARVEKNITNDNDNQIVNYKGFYWKRIGQQSSIGLANGATTAFNTTTSELRSQKHVRIMVRITPNNYDYTMVFDLTLNNLAYKNFGEVKTLHWADNTLSNLDPNKFIYITVAQYQTNTIRINIRNATGANISTGTIYTYIQTIKPNLQW